MSATPNTPELTDLQKIALGVNKIGTDATPFALKGLSARDSKDYEAAVTDLSLALVLDASGLNTTLLHNLANAYMRLNKVELAEVLYRKSVGLNPDSPEAHWSVGMCQLLLGNFDRGWKEYAWIARKPQKFKTLPENMLWQGQSLVGKKIVLFDEQGFGDTLQFLRFAPLIRQLGAEVYLEIKPQLRRLISANPHLGKVMDVQENTTVNAHFWQRLMGLPGLFNCNLASIPVNIPYIHGLPDIPVPPAVASANGFKVGLLWQGSPTNARDKDRSIPLRQYLPLFAVEGCHFFSLQHLSCAEESTALGLDDRLVDLSPQISDFADLSSAVAGMDLVITVDSAVAHLAGAMGKPVWTLIPFNPDWRWLLVREDSPWYPTMRLFRQQSSRDWAEVVHRVASHLGEITAKFKRESRMLTTV